MLAYIKGKVLKKHEYLVLLNNGLGYKVHVKKTDLNKVQENQEISLYLHQIITENKNELYGFFDFEEMLFFELLNSVSGIGPKSALAILNLGNLENLKLAISNADYKYLTKVSGIGSKTAKKIILELQEKIESSKQDYNKLGDDVDVLIEALQKLGYKQKEIKSILDKIDYTKSIEEQIKEALRLLLK